MKRHSESMPKCRSRRVRETHRSFHPEASLFTIHNPLSTASRGFTLVEMLVVVTIIGILASLITAAAISARRRAKIAAIVMDIKQIETACQAYKEKFGEYPPDFTDYNSTTGLSPNVMRHLAKAFPRYVPGVLGGGTGWTGFVNDVKAGWGVTIGGPSCASQGPGEALLFWLGGQPDFANPSGFGSPGDLNNPVRGFLGFAADPTCPFRPAAAVTGCTATPCASRIGPFLDIDATRVVMRSGFSLRYWQPGVSGVKGTGNWCTIGYLRAENGVYPIAWNSFLPFVDTRIGNACINPRSFQIVCSGLDANYGTTPPYGMPRRFPPPANEDTYKFDDITNFSGGTLEDAMP